tara:strand:- start:277 stop:855 length:579 start_codon:yes stop_codon:yes gene_type:complete
MIPIIHRVNKSEDLISLPSDFGIEIDIRSDGQNLVLGHDPKQYTENLESYIESFKHSFLIANVKESGIENQVIQSLNKKKIENFFLLDVEFPYILQNNKKNGNYLSLRYSKYESIESIKPFIGKVKWIWVDTYADFNVDKNIANILKNFKICIVSPSRWNSEYDLKYFVDKFKKFEIKIDAAMISDKDEVLY